MCVAYVCTLCIHASVTTCVIMKHRVGGRQMMSIALHLMDLKQSSPDPQDQHLG